MDGQKERFFMIRPCLFLSLLSHIAADAFDPDDLFKEPRAPTPLSSYLTSSDDDDDLRPRPKPTVYAYDAAAEREKVRQAWLAKYGEGGGAAIPNGIHG